MIKNVLKITYSVDSEGMTDEEFENQEERVLFVTDDMIIDLIEENDINFKRGDCIDYSYVHMQKL